MLGIRPRPQNQFQGFKTPPKEPSGKPAGRTCPKCDGQMLPGEDYHGKYFFCIQCGLYVDVVKEPAKKTLEQRFPQYFDYYDKLAMKRGVDK